MEMIWDFYLLDSEPKKGQIILIEHQTIWKKENDFKSLGIVSFLLSKVNNTMVNTLRVALEDEDSI